MQAAQALLLRAQGWWHNIIQATLARTIEYRKAVGSLEEWATRVASARRAQVAQHRRLQNATLGHAEKLLELILHKLVLRARVGTFSRRLPQCL